MLNTVVLIYFGGLRFGHTIKTDCINIQTVDSEITNFDFLEKGLGPVSPSYFVNDFSRKDFLMLYSTNICNP